MSADDPGRREVAYRLFAAEYDDADYSYSESDEERAPNYVVTPTGARVNRLFVVGVLTEVEAVSDDVLRARVVDPTGAFVLYAGQYQPDEQAMLERTDPPAFVAVTGKARTFQPEDSDRVYTSIRPESINEVDAGTRDRWTVQAAEQTLDRVTRAATALATGLTGDELRGELEDRGVEPGLADGIARALDHYSTTPAYLDAVRELALDAARVVAGQRDEVRELTVAPDEHGDVTAADLADTAVDAADDRPTAPETEVGTTAGDAETSVETGPGAETDTTATEGPGEERAVADTTPSEGAAEERATDHTADASPGEGDDQAPGGTDEGPGEFEPGEFDLSDEVREEVEAEYGTDFQSGTEVDEPGEADIETPEQAIGEPEPVETESESEPVEAASEGKEVLESEPGTAEAGDTADADTEAESEEPETESEGPEDPQEAVLAVMADLDEGGGADREAVVAAACERHGLTAEEVEDAIQDALMDGQCYEPDESSLKPI